MKKSILEKALVSGLFIFLFLVAAASAQAQGKVKVRGFEIDVKGVEPAIPQELQPQKAGKDNKWIVQFAGPIHQNEKKALTDRGAVIGDYLPEFAFIVTMDNQAKAQVEKLPFINGVVRFKPAYKVAKSLKDATGAINLKKEKPLELHFRIDKEASRAKVMTEVLQKKGKVLEATGDVLRVELAPEEISGLAQLEEVVWVDEAVPMELLNDTTRWVIQTNEVSNTAIWNHGLKGNNEVLGIGDSGLDYDMPWFRDLFGNPIGTTHRKVIGYDVTYGDDYDADTPGHGTHVAGIAAGDRSPVDGTEAANGMAPGSRLYLQDLTVGGSRFVNPPSDLGLLFIKAYDAGARIHTNSWGGSDNGYGTLSATADRFLWEHKDFLAFFANGNSGPNAGSVSQPATAKNVVSVGASLNGVSAGNIASFSSNGLTSDGRIKPTVTAPGDGESEGAGIISADSDGIKNSNNDGTISLRGTSMATPAVAGAAALVRQYFREGFHPSGTANPADALIPSAALIKATLINSAQSMGGSFTDGPIPATGQGWGRINLSRTLGFDGDGKSLEIVDETTGLSTGESWSRTLLAPADQPLKATLVWTDFPGAEGAGKALVNDLDLTITGPDGITYIGNVFSGGVSIPGGNADRLNVEEQVLVAAPMEGFYTLTVTGYNTPFGPQPFALVVTGASSQLSSAGFISLDRTSYNGSATVQIRLADRDLNMNGALAEQAEVRIASIAEPAGESVTLEETGTDTGIFRGTIPLTLGSAETGDGYLTVAAGDTLTVTYFDADDGSGNPAQATAIAQIDLEPPVVSSVTTAMVGETGARISWNTDEPADSSVIYSESGGGGGEKTDLRLVTEHTIDLSSLKEATSYSYVVASRDYAGNRSEDNNGGSFYSFTTLNVPPSLTIQSSNGLETGLDATVIYGTVEDPSGVASVTVNGIPVEIGVGDGNYGLQDNMYLGINSYALQVNLDLGVNTFVVVATDTLGNAREASISVTRFELPDLIITTVSGPGGGLGGGTINVANTVTANNGPSSGFYVAIYLSADTEITTADQRLGVRYLSSLASGEANSADTAVTLPAGLAAGTYYLGAIADYTNRIMESDETNNAMAGNPIVVAGMDLAISAVSGPTQGVGGAQISVANTVTASNGAASGFFVGIYLSTDTEITTADQRIGYRYLSSLANGASSSAETTVTLPTGLAPGTYYYGAIADYTNRIAEADETNNGRASNPVVVAGMDLAISAVSGPAQSIGGETITVANTVTASNGAASGFYVGIYFSPDAEITTADQRIGYRYLSSLANGASSSAETTVTLPTGLVAGTYYLGAIADYTNRIAEADETNNGRASNPVAVAGMDLAISAVSGPAQGVGGGQISIANTVTASNGQASGFYVGIYFSPDAEITIADQRIGYRYVSSLASGAASSAETMVTLPAGLVAGTYYLGAIADYTDRIAEADETNNGRASNPVVVAGMDLAISTVSGPAQGVGGGQITVADTVTASNGPASSFYVGIYLSTDAEITTADQRIGYRYVSSLASGAASSAGTVVTLPTGLAVGTYYLGAVADYTNRIAEADETNNGRTGNTITVAGMDLAISAVSGPAQGVGGGTITVANTVTASNGAASGFYVAIYLSSDAEITTADHRLGYRYLSSLASGAASSAGTVVTLPAGLAPGTYYLGAVADYTNRIAEADETNNGRTGNTITVAGMDLAISAVSGPAQGVGGGKITVANTVTASNGAAASFYVGIYLSPDAEITTADRRIGYRYLSSLASGAASSVETTVTLPTGLAAGTYFLGAIADDTNRVEEANEGNNARTGNPIALE